MHTERRSPPPLPERKGPPPLPKKEIKEMPPVPLQTEDEALDNIITGLEEQIKKQKEKGNTTDALEEILDEKRKHRSLMKSERVNVNGLLDEGMVSMETDDDILGKDASKFDTL